MYLSWKCWIVYLTITDAITSYGLFKNKFYGQVFFLIVAVSQLIAYVFFADTFGPQNFLIGFHLVTVGIYFFFILQKNRRLTG